MKNAIKIALFSLIGLNILVPCFVLKIGYFDSLAKQNKFERQLQDIRKKNASISALLNKPDAVTRLQNELAEEIAVLRGLMPPQAEMIAAQKSLSQFAREAEVVIVALRPVEDSIPLIVNEDDQDSNVSEIGEEGGDNVRVNMATIELKIQGSYENICNYITRIEECGEVTMVVEGLAMGKANEGDEVFIEADISVKIFYTL